MMGKRFAPTTVTEVPAGTKALRRVSAGRIITFELNMSRSEIKSHIKAILPKLKAKKGRRLG